MGISRTTKIEWSGIRDLGAMIEHEAEIMVWCDKCKANRRFTRDDLIALAEKVGLAYSLKNRRCRCRLTPGCRGWNRFCYLRGVYRPLSDPEMTLIWMDRDWSERFRR